LSTVSLRYFNVFGPGQHSESKYAAVFPGFISALVDGHAPEVHWDGEQSRDFTYIDDVVAANLMAASANERADGEWSISAAAGRKAFWTFSDRSPRLSGVGVSRSIALCGLATSTIKKAKNLLGWSPGANWEDSVKATVSWFVEWQRPAG
jgi:nucleoside-diphosphate-sugar epimerase